MHCENTTVLWANKEYEERKDPPTRPPACFVGGQHDYVDGKIIPDDAGSLSG